MASVISCEIHDHFEHVCVLRLPVTLSLKNSDPVSGVIVDLITRNKEEYLILNNDQGKATYALLDVVELVYQQGGIERQIRVK